MVSHERDRFVFCENFSIVNRLRERTTQEGLSGFSNSKPSNILSKCLLNDADDINRNVITVEITCLKV